MAKRKPLPYDEYSDPAWNVLASKEWAGEMRPNGADWEILAAEGSCPRCHHSFSANLSQDVAMAVDASPDTLGGPKLSGSQFTFLCECDANHPDRPDNGSGCGAGWNLIALWNAQLSNDPASVLFLPGKDATWEDRQNAEARRLLVQTELQRVREGADKWKTGLAALLGLIATVSVVKGRESITTLSVGTQHAIIVLIGLALILAVVAALLAMRAANGPLERRSLQGTTLYKIRSEEVNRALSFLKWARGLTIVAVLLLAVAIGVAWWSEEPTPGQISVTKTDKTVVCGAFKGATPDELRIETQPGTTVAVALADTKAVSFRQEC
jgi:hypothetical protein